MQIIAISLLIVLFILGACAPTAPLPPPPPESTPLPQIGDRVKSDSIQARVLQAEETHSISGGDITIDSTQGFILIPITVELENLGDTSAELTLAPETTTLRDAQQQYLLEFVGALHKGSLGFVHGSSGQMSLQPIDESWKLTGDFTNDVWTITLMADSHIEIILVYSVPIGSSGFELSLPGFVPISLED